MYTNRYSFLRMFDRLTVILLCFATVVFVVYVVSPATFNERDIKTDTIRRVLDESFPDVQHTWVCKGGMCIQKVLQNEERLSLETCNMLCSTPPLLPKPKQIEMTGDRTFSIFSKNRIFFKIFAPDEVKFLLRNATDIFLENVYNYNDAWMEEGYIDFLIINLTVNSEVVKLKLTTDESYNLTIKKEDSNVNVNIVSETYYGVRHGMETLSQLIWYDVFSGKLKILHDIEIQDSPSFPHRGLMVDTARNYFPIFLLKKVVGGMAASKLNVLHLHITDAVSFPLILPSLWQMASAGSYGPNMVYTPQDIRDLVKYANVRGVRVVLEIDAPGHVNKGWDFSHEKLVICGKDDIFNGHLNPDNNMSLDFLETIYSDLLELNDQNDFFYIGGDEVNLTCWKNTEAARSYSNMKLFWADYTNKMFERLKAANKNQFPDNVVLWSSALTDSDSISKLNNSHNLTIQFWLGDPRNILRAGYKIIYSVVDNWYLDCGFGPYMPRMSRGNCDPYRPWQSFYKYRPWQQFGHQELALGGEACLWSEQVEVDSLETRIWPRTAAFAERLWSDPLNFDNYDVYNRMVMHRRRLISRGMKAAAMWPRYCSENPGKC